MNIIFSSDKNTLSLEDQHPIPSKFFYPDWFKKVVPNTPPFKTIKGCMPVLDSIQSGYLLKLPQDIYIEHNVFNAKENKTRTFWMAKNSQIGTHSSDQLGGDNSYMTNKNGCSSFLKINNPWLIKTPPGYSCLFVPPMHREFDYFHILPGIVDTDTYDQLINFPICLNTNKYPSFVKTFERGLPYVQVIPFKRESWKMKITENYPGTKSNSLFETTLINFYKNFFWSKKQYK